MVCLAFLDDEGNLDDLDGQVCQVQQARQDYLD